MILYEQQAYQSYKEVLYAAPLPVRTVQAGEKANSEIITELETRDAMPTKKAAAKHEIAPANGSKSSLIQSKISAPKRWFCCSRL